MLPFNMGCCGMRSVECCEIPPISGTHPNSAIYDARANKQSHAGFVALGTTRARAKEDNRQWPSGVTRS